MLQQPIDRPILSNSDTADSQNRIWIGQIQIYGFFFYMYIFYFINAAANVSIVLPAANFFSQ